MSPPLTPDADEARRLLENELAKPEYYDARNWIYDQLDRLIDWLTGGPGQVTTLSDGQLAILVVVVAVAAAAALWAFMGPLRRDRRRRAGSVLDHENRNAADLREDARRLAASDAWGQATLQLYRAIVRSLGERALIDETPGMTAHEAATRAAPRLPALAGRLVGGADVFDALAYGNHAGSESQYQEMLELDAAVAAARPTLPEVVAKQDAAVSVEVTS